MCIKLRYCVGCRYITAVGAEEESSAPLGEGAVAPELSLSLAVLPPSLGMSCVTHTVPHLQISKCTDTHIQLQQIKNGTKAGKYR